MSKVGGRGQMHLLSGVAYSHHINRLMNYVAVSCGACDRDTMTRLKSEELIQATLHFGYKAQSPMRFFLSLFFFLVERGGRMRPEPRSWKLHCINWLLQRFI